MHFVGSSSVYIFSSIPSTPLSKWQLARKAQSLSHCFNLCFNTRSHLVLQGDKLSFQLPSQNKELARVVHLDDLMTGLDEISQWQLSVGRVVTSVTWDWEQHKLTTVCFYFTNFAQFTMYTTMLNLFNFSDPNKKDWTIPKKQNKNDCNPPFTWWCSQGYSWCSQGTQQNIQPF